MVKLVCFFVDIVQKGADFRHTPLGSPQTMYIYRRNLRRLGATPIMYICSFSRGGEWEAIEQYVLHSLQNAVAKLRKRIGINEENEKNVRGDDFSFSVWVLPPLSYLRYPRYRNYGNGYVVITSVGVSVVGGDVCAPRGMSVDGICVTALQCYSSPNALPFDENSDILYLYIIYIIILYIVIYKYIIYYFDLPLTSLTHFGTVTL